MKKVFRKYAANLQENTHAGVQFWHITYVVPAFNEDKITVLIFG